MKQGGLKQARHHFVARSSAVCILAACLLALPNSAFALIRGDANASGSVTLSDALVVLNYLFVVGSSPPACLDGADANDDGDLNLLDPLTTLNFLFVQGSAPLPAPYPEDGVDPTPDGQVCDGPIYFQTVAQGNSSGVTGAVTEVILDDTSWVSFWSTHSSAPLPAVDFDDEMVIVILASFDSLGFSYNVDEIVVTGDVVDIEYTFSVPGIFFPEVSQVHHIVRTERVMGTYNFNQFDAPPPP